jgi:hypothetical protein
MHVIYTFNIAEFWPRVFYSIRTNQGALTLFLMPPAIISVISARATLFTYPIVSVATVILTFLFWWAYMGLLLLVKARSIAASAPTNMTGFTAGGVVDIMPQKTTLVPWSFVRDVRVHDGAIYIWANALSGVEIPASAFRDPNELHVFLAAAREAWQGDTSLIASYKPTERQIPDPTDVWPPPPAGMEMVFLVAGRPWQDVDWTAAKARLTKRQSIQRVRNSLIALWVAAMLLESFLEPSGRSSALMLLIQFVMGLSCIALLVVVVIEYQYRSDIG